jgi:hypothetical protein
MDKQEIKYLLATILTLGFCFSFRDWGIDRFDIGVGIGNLIFTTILVAFSIMVHELSHKKIAEKYNAIITFRTWSTLLATAIIITIITNGYIVFSAVWVVAMNAKPFLRPKHKYPHLGPFERAKIAATGPMANFILGLIAAILFIKTGAVIWDKLMIINLSIGVMNLIPFWRIVPILMVGSKDLAHNLAFALGKKVWGNTKLAYMEGEIIYFGSRTLSIFLLSLTLITSLIVFYLKMVLLGVIVGLISSIAIWILMEWYLEPHGAGGDAPPPLPKIHMPKFGK